MFVAQTSKTSFQPRRGGMSEPVKLAHKSSIDVAPTELAVSSQTFFYKHDAAPQLFHAGSP